MKSARVDEGLTPTMVERIEPQLLLVSTAHRMSTSLMLSRRRVALAALEEPATVTCLVEWSAPRDMPIDEPESWRLASPHWGPNREKTVRGAYERALNGEVADIDEPDPIEGFRAQWLNQWPLTLVRGDKGEPLLEDYGQWHGRRG